MNSSDTANTNTKSIMSSERTSVHSRRVCWFYSTSRNIWLIWARKKKDLFWVTKFCDWQTKTSGSFTLYNWFVGETWQWNWQLIPGQRQSSTYCNNSNVNSSCCFTKSHHRPRTRIKQLLHNQYCLDCHILDSTSSCWIIIVDNIQDQIILH